MLYTVLRKAEIMRKINDLPKKIIFTAFYLALLFVLYKLGASCIFMNIFHIPCPGCGMMRAMISVLHLDFWGALNYHFMFWSMPVLYLYFLFDGKLFTNKKLNTFAFVLIAIGFGINWIYHIIFPI